MSFTKWLTVTITLIVLIGLTIYVGTTGAFFVDDEQSTGDSLGFEWGLVVLNDGFENTGAAWDNNWDENGITSWIQSSDYAASGSYSAKSDPSHLGYLTTDEIDASDSLSISVLFKFYPVNFDVGEVVVQAFNGTAYNTLWDLRNYATFSNLSWCTFSEVINDPQYFIPGFRLRFVSSGMTSGEAAYLDDVMIITDSNAPGIPQNLSATQGDREVVLDWDDNSLIADPDLAGYNVYSSLTPGGPYSKVNAGLVTVSNYTDTGLTNGTPYYYVVTSVDLANNESNYSTSANATPADIAPHAPTGLTGTAGDTVVQLDWNDNTDYDLAGYNVYRSTTNGTGYVQINGSLVANTTSNYTDTGLTNGTTYYYVVTAEDVNSHESTYSGEADVTPTDLPPSAPTGLTASEGDRLVNLNWNDNTEYDMAGYNVYRSTTSGSGYVQVNGSLVANSTSNYTDTELTGGTTYYYVVTAVDANSHESGYSSEASATPNDLPPSAPTGLNATGNDREVALAWNDNTESDVTGYDVYRSTTNGTGYSKINTETVNVSSYTDTEVTGGTTYYYVVKAVDAIAQSSGYSNQASATPYDSLPGQPTGLGTTAGDRQAVIYWNANPENDIAGYNLYRSTTSGSGYSKKNTSLITTENYTDTGLVGGTTYYYVLKAVDLATQESVYSAEASATPYDSPPAPPANLVITPGDGAATLDWDDNTEDDLAGYNVYRSETSGSGYAKVNSSLVANSTYLDSGLTGGTTYYYVVTAVDLTSHESTYSSEDSVTPTDPPPGNPTGLTAVPHDATVSLDWNDNTEPDLAGYNVYRSETTGTGFVKINTSLVTTSNYTDTGLINDTTYYYVVTAVDIHSSESVPSTEQSATPNLTPSAPTGLTATAGNKLVNLDWNDNPESDIAGYNVYRSLTSNSSYVKINGTVVANTTSNYTDTGLVGGTTYYYVVTAVDTIENESPYSTEDSATPSDLPPSAPSNLSATAGDRQATLDWDDNTEEDLDGYNIYRSLSSGSGYAKLNSSLLSTSNYTDTGLNGTVTYYYIVNAVDLLAQESANSTTANVTPYDLAPSAPAGLTATAGDKSVSLDWNDNSEEDVTGYNVYRSLTSGSGYAKINGVTPVSTSNYTDTGLVGGTTYYYVVTAVDALNESSYSGEDSATATDAAPSAPTGLSVSPGMLENTLSWDSNTESDLDGYNVYRSTTSGSGYVKVNTSSLVSSTNYTDSNLMAGTTYYYVITAVDLVENESTYSTEAEGTPVGPTLIDDSFDGNPWYANFDENGVTSWIQDSTHVVTGTYSAYSNKTHYGYLTTDNLYASLTSSITIDFWYYPHSIAAGEFVLLAYNGTAYNQIFDMGSYPGIVANSWNHISEVVTDDQYFIPNFNLRLSTTLSGSKDLWVDDFVLVTDDLPPLVPTGLVATAGEQQVSLDWNDNSEADLYGYNLYRSTTSGSGYTKINSSVLTSSNYTDTGLLNGTTYYYVVTALDVQQNESEYSVEDSATPQDLVPAAPTGLAATPGNELVSLDWNDNSEIDIAGYNIYRNTISGSGSGKTKINTSGLVTTSNYTDTNVNGGTTYYYMVTAVDLTAHESAYSTEASATPIDLPPAAPTGLSATPGDRQAVLDWNDNSEPDLNGYNLYRSITSGSGYSIVNTSGLIGSSNFTDTGLTGNTTYYYVVTAVDLAAHESSTSNETSVTPTDPPPAAPTGLSLTPGDREVSLNWQDNTEPDLDGYNVYRSLTSNSSYVKINTGLLSTSDYIDTGLSGNTTYYYVVTAVDLGTHESSYSTENSTTPYDNPPAAPQNLSASIGASVVNLNWDDNTEDDLAGYNVYRSIVSGANFTKINGSVVTSSEYSDAPPVEDTYYYRVKAVDLGGHESNYSNEVTTPYDNPPSTPTGLTATPHDSYVSLDWNDNPEADIHHYDVYRSETNNSSTSGKINSENITVSEYTDNTSINDHTYYYWVKAVDYSDQSSENFSSVASATPNATPSPPTGLTATAGDRQVFLDWNDNTEGDLAGYNIYRSITSGTGYTKLNGTLQGISNYTDSGLTGGITYYYVVTAVDTIANESNISSEDSATPYDSPPSAPTNLSASAGDRQVTLNWDNNTEPDLAGYDIYRSVTTNTSYSKINGSLVTNNTYTDTGLTGNITYYYRVKAVDALSQLSAYSNEDNATPTDAPPSAPTNLSASAGDKQVSLDWDDNSEADLAGYNVYRSIGDNSSYSQLNGSLVLTSNYTDTGLTGGVTYYYKVMAVDNGTNESGYSNEDSATPTDAPPSAPTGLVATPHNGYVSLDWNDNSESDLAGYNVYRSTTSGSGYSKLNSSGLVSTSNYTDNSVTNENTYYYVVTAVDAGTNESGYSNEDSALPNGPPSAPTGLVATAGNGQVSLDWNDNSEGDIAGYNVYRSTTSNGSYTKINVSLVGSSFYTNTGLTNGTTYYYVVTAVDTINNESGYSNEDSATPSGVIFNDGFEGTPWTVKWDGNGVTNWSTGTGRSGTGVSAYHAKGNTYLTSDDMDASPAVNGITVTFWFNLKATNKGPLYVQIYNGSTWNTTWYNLQTTPGYAKTTWAQFNMNITDSQYFKSNFRIRFDGSSCTTDAYIDDVLITTY